jgi:hypothetical protein
MREAAGVHEQSHTGGLRRGSAYVTWPLARLVINAQGISVEPSRKALAPAFRLVGMTDLDFDWSDIESVFPSRGLVPATLLNHGVSFVIDGRTMTWWSPTGTNAREVLDEVRDFAPEKVRVPGTGGG